MSHSISRWKKRGPSTVHATAKGFSARASLSLLLFCFASVFQPHPSSYPTPTVSSNFHSGGNSILLVSWRTRKNSFCVNESGQYRGTGITFRQRNLRSARFIFGNVATPARISPCFLVTMLRLLALSQISMDIVWST